MNAIVRQLNRVPFDPTAFAAADRVMFFDTAANNFTTLSLTDGAWSNGTLGMNTRPFAPQEAALVQVRGTDLTFTGEVRASSFATPLASGTQLIGTGWPVITAAPVTGLRAGTAATTADRLRLWNGDAAATSGYTSWYLDSTTTPPVWQLQDPPLSSFDIPPASFAPFHGLFLLRDTPLLLKSGLPW